MGGLDDVSYCLILINSRLLASSASVVEAENDKKAKMVQLSRLVKKTFEKLPAYIFLSAFPQIVSRICHPNDLVFQILEQTIINVFCVFPQQGFWHLVSVSKSTHSIRSKRCNEIFSKIKSNDNGKVSDAAKNSQMSGTQSNQERIDVLLTVMN